MTHAALGQKKQKGALLSVGLNVFLILMKLVMGIACHSVAVLASAVDSIVDLVASVLAYGAVIISDTPPDDDHPFGHGKFEDFAGLIEAVLIIVGAFFIINEALPRFFSTEAPQLHPMPAIIVMGVSLVLDLAVSQWLFKVAAQTESSALLADAHHLSTDVWSSLAIIIGLGLVKVTGNPIFDPIVAVLVAVMILKVGVGIVRQVFRHLMDEALPAAEAEDIRRIIHEALPDASPLEITDLKTRRSGSHRLIVFNLLVDPLLTVAQAHTYCDRAEAALEAVYPQTTINIHLEPYSKVVESLAAW